MSQSTELNLVRNGYHSFEVTIGNRTVGNLMNCTPNGKELTLNLVYTVSGISIIDLVGIGTITATYAMSAEYPESVLGITAIASNVAQLLKYGAASRVGK